MSSSTDRKGELYASVCVRSARGDGARRRRRDVGSDPGLAFDSNGTAFYSYIIVFFSTGGSINGTEMAVSRSTDHGLHWTPTFFNLQTGGSQFNDKPMITVDTGSGAHHHQDR